MSSIPEIVRLAFEVDEDYVSLCLRNGEKVALFPSDRLGPIDVENSLQQAVIALMHDLD